MACVIDNHAPRALTLLARPIKPLIAKSLVPSEKSVLIVAYHFPPHAGSSGFLRSVKFARYLPDYGWKPMILTTSPGAYERLDYGPLKDVPVCVPIHRAPALDTKRHLSVRGRYPRMIALPDRWVSWTLTAVPAGLRVIRSRKVGVLLTTYPIATAVLIGLILHRLSSIPWVVDFRDSMTEDNWPPDPTTHRVYTWIERQALRHAALLIFTAAASRDMCLRRNPQLSPSRCVVVPNGYDEEDFRDLKTILPAEPKKRLSLVHSGLMDPKERDPSPFFEALATLKGNSIVSGETLSVELRAPGSEAHYQRMIEDFRIGDLVHILPPLPYRDSIADAAKADALLLFQAKSVDHQIPAKTYEYLRLRKPILAVVSPSGETAQLLDRIHAATIVDITNTDAIGRVLPSFLDAVRSRTHPLADLETISGFSRQAQAGALARCLDGLVGA